MTTLPTGRPRMTGKRSALEANLAAAQIEIEQLESRLGASLDPFDFVDIAEMSLHSLHPAATGAHEIDTPRVPLPEWGAVNPRYGVDVTFDVPADMPVRFVGCWARDGRYLGCVRLATPPPLGGYAATLVVSWDKKRIVSA